MILQRHCSSIPSTVKETGSQECEPHTYSEGPEYEVIVRGKAANKQKEFILKECPAYKATTVPSVIGTRGMQRGDDGIYDDVILKSARF